MTRRTQHQVRHLPWAFGAGWLCCLVLVTSQVNAQPLEQEPAAAEPDPGEPTATEPIVGEATVSEPQNPVGFDKLVEEQKFLAAGMVEQGDYYSALRALQSALDAAPGDAPEVPELVALRDEYLSHPATLRLRVEDPVAMSSTVDEIPVPELLARLGVQLTEDTSYVDIPVVAGNHLIDGSFDAGLDDEKHAWVSVPEGQTVVWPALGEQLAEQTAAEPVTPEPVTPEPVTPEPVTPVEPVEVVEESGPEETLEPMVQAEERPIPKAIWVAAGVTFAGLAAGTFLGIQASETQTEFDKAPSEALADKGERLALMTDLALGVSLMGAVTTLVLTLHRNDPGVEAENRQGPDRQSAQVRFVPEFVRGGAVLTANGRF